VLTPVYNGCFRWATFFGAACFSYLLCLEHVGKLECVQHHVRRPGLLPSHLIILCQFGSWQQRLCHNWRHRRPVTLDRCRACNPLLEIMARKCWFGRKFILSMNSEHTPGQGDLLRWFSSIALSKPRVVLTHGDDIARKALSSRIRQRSLAWRQSCPHRAT
jgi:hypothetical protein